MLFPHRKDLDCLGGGLDLISLSLWIEEHSHLHSYNFSNKLGSDGEEAAVLHFVIKTIFHLFFIYLLHLVPFNPLMHNTGQKRPGRV